MAATEDQLKRICNVLHSRGREATPQQVAEWLDKMVARYRKSLNLSIDEVEICEAVEDGHTTWTMCLHLHFGDAL
jgi:hypothetical protein